MDAAAEVRQRSADEVTGREGQTAIRIGPYRPGFKVQTAGLIRSRFKEGVQYEFSEGDRADRAAGLVNGGHEVRDDGGDPGRLGGAEVLEEVLDGPLSTRNDECVEQLGREILDEIELAAPEAGRLVREGAGFAGPFVSRSMVHDVHLGKIRDQWEGLVSELLNGLHGKDRLEGVCSVQGAASGEKHADAPLHVFSPMAAKAAGTSVSMASARGRSRRTPAALGCPPPPQRETNSSMGKAPRERQETFVAPPPSSLK